MRPLHFSTGSVSCRASEMQRQYGNGVVEAFAPLVGKPLYPAAAQINIGPPPDGLEDIEIRLGRKHGVTAFAVAPLSTLFWFTSRERGALREPAAQRLEDRLWQTVIQRRALSYSLGA